MKTQYRETPKPPGGDPLAGRDRGGLQGFPELDTYKQLLQPNRHAGSSLFWGFPYTLQPSPFMNAEIIADMRYLAENASTPEARANWFLLLRDTCSAIIEQATIQGGGSNAKSTR